MHDELVLDLSTVADDPGSGEKITTVTFVWQQSYFPQECDLKRARRGWGGSRRTRTHAAAQVIGPRGIPPLDPQAWGGTALCRPQWWPDYVNPLDSGETGSFRICGGLPRTCVDLI